KSLREIKDDRAVKPLMNAVKDENSVVRENAARTLGRMKDDRAVKPLIGALKDENLVVRAGASTSLS
ncbi:HEAT repeat domain-containing protein, partial [Thermodesulfobacteriota bacterium]